MENRQKGEKLQLRIDIILTILFLITIFFFGIMTVVTDSDEIIQHATRRKYLNNYVTGGDADKAHWWDRLDARVKSLDSYIAANIYGATELGYANSTLQYAIGKKLISTGGQQMITLNSGHLYDLQNYLPMENSADRIAALVEPLDTDTKFMFVYEHPTIYSDTQMPEGYGPLDYSAEIADEITSKLRDRGIDVLDSRDVLADSGMELSEYLYYTDQHWASRAAMEMARAISKELGLDYTRLDIDRFETETYEKLFMGKYGQRVGPGNIDPDDVTVFWPKYPTTIHRYTNYLGEITDLTGEFRESVIRWKYLQPDEGSTWNIMAYYDYGLVENLDIFENPDAPDTTILLLKDSYSSPIGAFMSLTAGKVISVDMRRAYNTYEELLEMYDPDAVVVAYSMQMLRDDDYKFE